MWKQPGRDAGAATSAVHPTALRRKHTTPHSCSLLFFCAAPQGNRDNIDSLAGGSQKVLVQVLKLIDAHDLYGR